VQGYRYIEDAVSLGFDAEKCTGCRTCTMVCPHGVWKMDGNRAQLADRGACMECGACALNCASGAISVNPGVGCAGAIVYGWLTNSEPSCGCSTEPSASGAGMAAAVSCCGGSGEVREARPLGERSASSGCGCAPEGPPRRRSNCC
jgi:NAD-dependent dihydropyrimidine dehydrogenase PreA subunit